MLMMDICSDKCTDPDDGLHSFIPPRGSIRAESNGREPAKAPEAGGWWGRQEPAAWAYREV
jgi:hypothetical protein